MLARPSWLRPEVLDRLKRWPMASANKAGDQWKRTPGPLRWTFLTLVAVSVVIIAVLIIFDWNWLRGPVSRMASQRLHRQVQIVGDLKVHPWSLSPRAEVYDLRIAQPDWAVRRNAAGAAGSEDMVRVRRLAVQIKLLPLLRGQTILPLVELDQPKVRLLREASGRANWTFGDGKPKKTGFKLPAIRHFIINDGDLRIDDRRRKVTFVGTVSSNERATGAQRGVFHLAGDGRLNGEVFHADVTGAPLLNVSPDRPYPFKAQVTSGPSQIWADGSITKPFNLGRFSTALTLQGPDLNRLYDLTGLAFPNTPPYRVSGRLSRDGAHWRYEGIRGRVGDSDLSGDVSVETGRERPYLKAALVSNSLDFDDLMAVFGGAPKVGRGETASADQKAIAASMAAEQRLLPDSTLQVDRIRSMDADVRFRALRVKDAPGLPVRAIDITVDLEAGVLTADPLTVSLPQGAVNGRIRLDARKATPVTTADLRLTRGRVQDFVPIRSGGAPAIEGPLSARIDLTGAGNSVHRAASNANGRASVVISGGRMRQAFAELLGINASKGLILLLSKDNKETSLNCAVADFRVVDGVLRAERIVIDTGVVRADGSGIINLQTERMDLRLQGHSKKLRLVRLLAPITLRGPLRSPKVGIDGGKAVAQGGFAAALGALVSPLAAVLPFVTPGGAKDANCDALLGASMSASRR